MEKEPVPALIESVVEAMLHAAADNTSESPDTVLEAMAKAAVKVIRADDERR